ncbi:MAG: hypothetical protein GY934_15945 [Gammaproteobacteria bacterium]|nr:hypothetical protein [Gammaproteobacteria bacterium]
MSSRTPQLTLKHSRRTGLQFTAAALIIAASTLFSQGVWAGGSYGLKVVNAGTNVWVYTTTSSRQCLSSYTDAETLQPGDYQYFTGTSDGGSSIFDSCAYKDSIIRYSFSDSEGNEFAYIYLKDPSGIGSWRIDSQSCDVSASPSVFKCTLGCSSGDVYRDNDWLDPICLVVQ